MEALGTLSKTHKLVIMSDTWASIVPQLKYNIGVSQYLSFCTFSCFVGAFKPDRRIYSARWTSAAFQPGRPCLSTTSRAIRTARPFRALRRS